MFYVLLCEHCKVWWLQVGMISVPFLKAVGLNGSSCSLACPEFCGGGERHCPWSPAVSPASCPPPPPPGRQAQSQQQTYLLYEFIQSVCILHFNAHTPGHQGNRLIEHLGHVVADIEGPEPHQEAKLAQALLIDCLSSLAFSSLGWMVLRSQTWRGARCWVYPGRSRLPAAGRWLHH